MTTIPTPLENRSEHHKEGRVDQYTIPATRYTVQGVPGFEVGELVTCYVRVVDLPQLDKWLKVNPRRPQRSTVTGRLSTENSRSLLHTLRHHPEDFALKNIGLFFLVQEISHSHKRDELTITMSNTSRHGIVNGGHTYAAIRQAVDEYWEALEFLSSDAADPEDEATQRLQDEAPLRLDEAYVRLHVFSGIPKSKVVTMAQGLNRSLQVDDASLLNLTGAFRGIRKAMRGHAGEGEVAYFQGDSGSMYITDVLHLLELFNCDRWNDETHPHSLYRAKKKLLAIFGEDWRAKPSPVELIIPSTPEILELYDLIREAIPRACKARRFDMRKMKVTRSGGKAGLDEGKTVELPFTGNEIDVRVPNGWTLPILAAFRAAVSWNLEKGSFKWKTDPKALLERTIKDLVKPCIDGQRAGRLPQDVGRDPLTYQNCYDQVRMTLMKGKKG